MKRFTSFLFALLAVVCSFSAAADNVTFQIQVDRPTAVICTVNGTEQTLTEGLNDISVPMGNSVVLESVAPYMISSVVNKGWDSGKCKRRSMVKMVLFRRSGSDFYRYNYQS